MRRIYTMIVMVLTMAIVFGTSSNYIYAYEWDDDNFEMEEDYDYARIKESNITLREGDKYRLDYDYESYYDPVWITSDASVATVSGGGKVTANGVGTAKITMLCGSHSDSVIVTVKNVITYKQIAKKMKQYAKNKKGFVFKNIDVGTKCRLYGYSCISSDDSKADSEGYGYATAFQSYVELTNKKGRPHLKLVIWGEVIGLSIYDISLYPYKLKLNTANRKLNFDLKYISTKDKYKKGVYKSDSKSYALISSDEMVRTDVVKKYKKMLTQKTFKLKFTFDEGGSYQIGIPKSIRKNWRRLATFYQKLLKDFE